MKPRMEPITDASAWTGEQLERDTSWRFDLSPRQVEDLRSALEAVRGLAFPEITRADFALASLGETTKAIHDELRRGRGFAVLRGFPTDVEYPDLERLFWGLCTHLGTGVTQNKEAGLIHYVTDGALAPKDGARILGTPRPSALHVDLSDCVALLCARQAPDDPRSIVASAMTVYNEILEAHPEYIPRLAEGFRWRRIETHPGERAGYTDFKVPGFSTADGVVSCRFHPGWIRSGVEAAGETLTDDDVEMFDFIADVAVANSFSFRLARGEVALCNNYTVFHGREGFSEVEAEADKRVLLRIWLDLPDVRPFSDEGCVRYGAVRHGKMGWTAREVLSGEYLEPHRRREDGVPVV